MHVRNVGLISNDLYKHRFSKYAHGNVKVAHISFSLEMLETFKDIQKDSTIKTVAADHLIFYFK